MSDKVEKKEITFSDKVKVKATAKHPFAAELPQGGEFEVHPNLAEHFEKAGYIEKGWNK